MLAETFVRTVIAVIGSSAVDLSIDQQHLPYQVGRRIAEAHCHLMTGGGPGIMAAASRGFCSVSSRAGMSIGVIPDGKPSMWYPNSWIELPIFTHLKGDNPKGADSRNHIIVRSAHGIVSFLGGAGTQAEVELAVGRGTSCPVVACLRGTEMIGRLGPVALQQLGVSVVHDLDAVIHGFNAMLMRLSDACKGNL